MDVEEKLNRLIDIGQELRSTSQPPNTGDERLFHRWRRQTDQYLQVTFGTDSSYLQDFRLACNAPDCVSDGLSILEELKEAFESGESPEIVNDSKGNIYVERSSIGILNPGEIFGVDSISADVSGQTMSETQIEVDNLLEKTSTLPLTREEKILADYWNDDEPLCPECNIPLHVYDTPAARGKIALDLLFSCPRCDRDWSVVGQDATEDPEWTGEERRFITEQCWQHFNTIYHESYGRHYDIKCPRDGVGLKVMKSVFSHATRFTFFCDKCGRRGDVEEK